MLQCTAKLLADSVSLFGAKCKEKLDGSGEPGAASRSP